LTGFRDPFLWREGGVWYLGVGSGVRKQGGRVLLYRSKDLRQWEYLHPLASGMWTRKENINPVESGEMWECPDFFKLGAKHVLLYSTAGKVRWETGDLDPQEVVFHPQRSGVLDHGAYYAQKTQLDAEGNRILWGWIPETRPEADNSAAGWAGCMALPRVLSLDAQNDLVMKIAPQAASLRGKKIATVGSQTAANGGLGIGPSLTIENLAGELLCTACTGAFSLTLADSGGPWWSLKMSQTGSGINLQVNEKSLELPVPPASELRFHLLLDASVAEFLCNDFYVLTSRIYRQPKGPLRAQLTEADISALGRLDAWQLRAISGDRLST